MASLRRVHQTAGELRMALLILDRIIEQEREQPDILFDTVQSLRKKILDTLDNTHTQGSWWTWMFKRHNTMGNALKEVKYLFGQLSYMKGLKRSDEFVPKEIASHLQATTSGTIEEDERIIGVEDVIGDLRHQLTPADSETHHRVITIEGMGGLGKTAIARYLYNDDDVAQRFSCRAWVHVGQHYTDQDLVALLIDDFKSCLGIEDDYKANLSTAENNKEYINKLLLEGNCPCLVVLDHVWKIEAWEYLKEFLPTNGGNRVIITTRKRGVIDKVAQGLGVTPWIFQKKLRFLNQEESWKMFCTTTGHPEDHKNIPTEAMVNTCGGLPLAIKALAKHLRRRKEHIQQLAMAPDFWAEFLTYQHSYERDVTQLLSLSYNDLRDDLKPCLLYIGMFPEKDELDVDKLIRMLTAETFIGHPTTDAEARRNITELIDNNLIHVASTLWEQPAKLKVQSLLRELIVQEASKVSSYPVLSFYIHAHPCLHEVHSLHIDKHVLHSNEIQEYLSCKKPNLMLETLRIYVETQYFELKHLVSLSKKMTTLVVLDMVGVSFSSKEHFKKLCEMIKCLKKLKYLGLVETSISKIPKTIGCLTSLQTLELDKHQNFQMIKEVKKLKKLQHLHGQFFGDISPIKNMSNLQTLKVVHVDEMSKIQMNFLINLQELHLSMSSNESFFFDITNLTKLDTLVLSELHSFPNLTPISFPENPTRILKLSLAGPIAGPNGELGELPHYITMLVLSESNLTKDPMDILGKLPNLKSLDLINSYVGKELNCKVNGFRALNFLRLYGMENLERLIVDRENMPALSKFHNGCTNSQLHIPYWLKQLPDDDVTSANNYMSP